MNEWKSAKLGDIAETCLGKMLDKEKNKGVLQPYIANVNLRWGGFDLKNLSKMRFEESESERYGLKPGDLVVCEGGEPGRCAIWRGEVPEMKIQKAIHRVRTKEDYSSEFLFYRFLLAGRNGELKKHFIGSTIKHLTGSSLKQVEFDFPSLTEQNRIASILTALDAKIDLNNRINAELEGMAKLLYDYWFVQFDFPMTAAQATTLGNPQLAGKPYRSSGGKMVYNEVLKHEIPEVWGAKSLSQLVPVTKESVNPADSPDEFFKLFSIPVFDATGTYSLEKGSNVGSNKFMVTGNDILVSKLNPWFSRVIYSPVDIEAVCSTEFVVWQTIASWMKAFLFIVARSPQFVTFCTQSATGTSNSHKRVNPEVMMSHSIPWEPGQAQSFGEIVNPILLARQFNEIQNKELAQLRDWLLPMLMNGQVTVN